MADKWPLANGNYSTAANWNGGTLPVDGDDIYADNRTIQMDIDVNLPNSRFLCTQRTGGTAGGNFNFTTTREITCLALVGGSVVSNVFTFNGPATTVTLNGATVTAGTITNAHGINFASANVSAVFNNCTFVGGNAGTRYAVYLNSSWGTVTFNNCTARGGAGGNAIFTVTGLTGSCSGTLHLINNATSTVGPLNISSGSWVLSGDVNHQGAVGTVSVASSASLQYTCTTQTFTGVFSGSGTATFWNFNVTTTNNAISSPAIVLPSVGSGASLLRWSGGNLGKVTYTGDVQLGASGPTHFAVFNASAIGTIKHVGTLTGANSSVMTSAGAIDNAGSSFANGVELVLDRIAPSAANQLPGLPPFVRFETTAQLTVQTETGTNHVIAATAALLDMPVPSNVRSGVSYNLGTQTGTCAVPPAGSVAFGVPVDATTGTGVLSGGGGSGDVTSIAGSAPAATNLKNMLTNVAGTSIRLNSLNVINPAGSAVVFQSTGANGNGMLIQGHGAGNGVYVESSSEAIWIVGGTGIEFEVTEQAVEVADRPFVRCDHAGPVFSGTHTALTNTTQTVALTQAAIDAIDAALLNAGDATDLIAAIVARIANTNVDQSAFVAAVKAAIFDASSAANKLSVAADGSIKAGSFGGAAQTQMNSIQAIADSAAQFSEDAFAKALEIKNDTALVSALL